jgi:hypothetical protein
VFKGNYKRLLADGSLAVYVAGDSILFQGKLYTAKEPVSLSPTEQSESWSFSGSTEIYNSSNPPLSPEVGQIWSKDGRFYSYYYDGNSFSWIEI